MVNLTPEGVPERLPVDEGYAWVVCAATATMMFCSSGMSKSLGVVLLLFQEHFQSDPVLTSLTVALVAAGFYFFVFFSNSLGMLIGYRTVAIGGAIMAPTSLLVTAFSPNIYIVVIFMGLIPGIAFSAMYGSSLVILSSYFKRRRALATGLAVAGGSLGVLIIPLLLNFLIEYYGFQGGLLVFSVVFLHAIPAGIALRPPKWWLMNRDVQTKHTKPGCQRFVDVLKVMVDRDLLTSPVFYMLVASLVLGYMGYIGILVFLPSAAKSFFDDQMMSISLVSIIGACDFVGRMLGGYIADLRKIRFSEQMGISLLIPGTVTLVIGLYPTVWLMFVAAVLIGLFSGAYSGLVTPIIIDYFGLPKVSAGFGIICFLMGFFMVPWPTALMFLFEATKTYKSVLVASACMSLVSSIMFFFLGIVHSRQSRKDRDDVIIEADEKDNVLDKDSYDDEMEDICRSTDHISVLAYCQAEELESTEADV